VPTLIAISYPDETTGAAAAAEARTMARDLVIEAEAIAVVSRNRDGGYQVDTNHRAVRGSAGWGMYWALLFSELFFAPATRTGVGARLGVLVGEVAKSGIGPQLQAQVRELTQPGTSAVFLVVDRGTPRAAVERLHRVGATVLEAPLGKEPALPFALHGERPIATAPSPSC
jgi:uncharacterized membrane protein